MCSGGARGRKVKWDGGQREGMVVGRGCEHVRARGCGDMRQGHAVTR